MSDKDFSHIESVITILRHGESLHNIDRNYSFPDPPLTSKGQAEASRISIEGTPDIIIISPMNRTIQTALLAFGPLISGPDSSVKVQIWPELREAHDAICNKGVAKENLMVRFPEFDFSNCHAEWDYETHTIQGAVARAESVREKLRELTKVHKHIALVTHRGFIAFLAQGIRFQTCETRNYRFANIDELKECRYGVNVDTLEAQDFGPNLLMPLINKTEPDSPL